MTWKLLRQTAFLYHFSTARKLNAQAEEETHATYLYNRFGIQAEVEVTKDKVGNFLKSLVDDSGKRKGDSGDLKLQC